MSHIVAGRFQLQDQAREAMAALTGAGFTRERVTSFYVNPPGQHSLFNVGGDADNSPGAHQAPHGSLVGAGAGGAVGALGAATALAALPFVGPAAAVVAVGVATGVGAYAGSLVGTLSSLGEPVEAGTRDAAEKAEHEASPLRRAGMMVAVAIEGEPAEDDAIRVLRSQGAVDIERSEGTIADGHWVDFDPLRPVVRTDGPAPASAATPLEQHH